MNTGGRTGVIIHLHIWTFSVFYAMIFITQFLSNFIFFFRAESHHHQRQSTAFLRKRQCDGAIVAGRRRRKSELTFCIFVLSCARTAVSPFLLWVYLAFSSSTSSFRLVRFYIPFSSSLSRPTYVLLTRAHPNTQQLLVHSERKCTGPSDEHWLCVSVQNQYLDWSIDACSTPLHTHTHTHTHTSRQTETNTIQQHERAAVQWREGVGGGRKVGKQNKHNSFVDALWWIDL